MVAQAKIAEELGFDKENIKILSSGDVLELDEDSAEVTGRVQVGNVMIDGNGVGDVGNIVIRDRQRLADDGIIIVVMTLDSVTGLVLDGPDIVSRGFVYVREADELMSGAKERVEQTLDKYLERNIVDWSSLKSGLRDSLSKYLYEKTKRRPMILPIIQEI